MLNKKNEEKKMSDIILFLLIIWDIGLSSVLFAVIKCQNNQSELLYTLRDDLNTAKICDECIVNTLKKGKVILPKDYKQKKAPKLSVDG